MEDEIQHPVIRKLYRQSSVETPLSPSIPSSDSDSDNDDSNAKSTSKHPQSQEALPQNKSAKKPLVDLCNRYESIGMIKITPVKKPQNIPENNLTPDYDEPRPSAACKEKTKPIAPHEQAVRMDLSVIKELRGRQVVANSDNESKVRVVGGKKKKPPPPSRSAASKTNKIPCPAAPVSFESDTSEKPVETINRSAIFLDELRRHEEKSLGFNKAFSDTGMLPKPEVVTISDCGSTAKINVDESEEGTTSERKLKSGEADPVDTTKLIPVMASPRPKSPRPVPVSAKKDEKEESFWEKIGTLGRKKRIKEVQEVQEEGKYAIDSPGLAANPDMPPEEYTLDENEERSMMEPRSLEDPKLQELMFVLIEWINDELADQRIIVKDIAEDLYDGQVLQKLLERLTGEKLDVPEVTQSEEGQKQKLAVVLQAANRVLNRYPPYKWSVDSVHSKNIVSILHLLVGLARQFRAPVRLPERVAVQVVVVRKKEGQLIHRTVREEITSTYEDLGMRCERDAFDTLFDHAPEKLAVVKKSLVTFVNKHLSKVHLEVTELDTQFHDGVFLTLLLGLLEGFFVPLGSFHLTPKTHDQKVHNVSFAFDLMQEIGLVKPKARPEDIVNLDLKSTLRVLYNLFTKYKGMN